MLLVLYVWGWRFFHGSTHLGALGGSFGELHAHMANQIWLIEPDCGLLEVHIDPLCTSKMIEHESSLGLLPKIFISHYFLLRREREREHANEIPVVALLSPALDESPDVAEGECHSLSPLSVHSQGFGGQDPGVWTQRLGM